MFAICRIDPPWQPISRKRQRQRMDGGKGGIDHYVTPIKANRVITEVVGKCEYFEGNRVLEEIASKLLYKAMAITQIMLENMNETEESLKKNNANPWTFKYIIHNNLGGCHNWLSPKDKIWFGKYC